MLTNWSFVKYFEQLLAVLYFLIAFLNTDGGANSKICVKIGDSDFFPHFVTIEKFLKFVCVLQLQTKLFLNFSFLKFCSDSYVPSQNE